jgi:hypothetical protein
MGDPLIKSQMPQNDNPRQNKDLQGVKSGAYKQSLKKQANLTVIL